ncbi:hypothetical protein QJS10_CPA01g01678 [Acorus calamus]|uniref:VQ domain-containing protein n=1 Tax=Acorus calamus TaxID=4465 RepID=A0AAV9FJ32_ACOCL|nr:hypothetical protein QJS10_CPA01g01678 [Acorus calamus]
MEKKKALKRNQRSLKICKDNYRKQENSLSKVLPPKVYITDSSSFKSLVQDLTGNGINPMFSSPQIPSEEFSVGECSSEVGLSNDSSESLEAITADQWNVLQCRELEVMPVVFDIDGFLSVDDDTFFRLEEVWSLPWDVLNYMASFDGFL